jgi:hypothetical protein
MQYANENYPGRFITRICPIHWPPQTPDLIPLDACLWDWMKNKIYKTKVHTHFDMHFGCCCSPKETLRSTQTKTHDFHTRVAKCTEVDGGIYEY